MMLRIYGDMLNPLNYSFNVLFLARKEPCIAVGVINPSVMSVFGWLLHTKASVTLALSPFFLLISDWWSSCFCTGFVSLMEFT